MDAPGWSFGEHIVALLGPIIAVVLTVYYTDKTNRLATFTKSLCDNLAAAERDSRTLLHSVSSHLTNCGYTDVDLNRTREEIYLRYTDIEISMRLIVGHFDSNYALEVDERLESFYDAIFEEPFPRINVADALDPMDTRIALIRKTCESWVGYLQTLQAECMMQRVPLKYNKYIWDFVPRPNINRESYRPEV